MAKDFNYVYISNYHYSQNIKWLSLRLRCSSFFLKVNNYCQNLALIFTFMHPNLMKNLKNDNQSPTYTHRQQGVCQIFDTEFPDFSLILSSFPRLSIKILLTFFLVLLFSKSKMYRNFDTFSSICCSQKKISWFH